MYGGSQQWSTYKQSAPAIRCAMCQNPNPFMVGSGSSAAYFQPQRPPPNPKPVAKVSLNHQAKNSRKNQIIDDENKKEPQPQQQQKIYFISASF